MPENPKDEKLEFLKREEIKTMQKDIARLRELEAQREREKVAVLKEEPKKEKEEIKIVPPVKPPEISIPKPHKRPSPLKKVLVRMGISLLCLLLLGFFYWFFAVRKPPFEEDLPPTDEEVELEVEEPKISLPSPLISVESTIAPEVSKLEDIPGVVNQIMEGELPEESFTQIAIKNTAENRLAFLEEISQAFQIEALEGIFEKLEENFTLAVYSQKEGKRITLIAKTEEKEALDELLEIWEEKISKDGFSISGQKISSLSSYFKTAHYKEISFRYLTISKTDLGICYSLFDDYFILTTSFGSIQKVIEDLKNQITLKEKVGQLFIVGFEEKTITPQLKEFFKKYKPGGVLLLSKNIENKEQLKSLTSGLQALSLEETGLPLLIAVDQEGEPMSRIGFLEEKTGQSEIESTTTAFQIGQNRGQELKELGINLNLAPVLDLAQEGDFLFSRSFQKTQEEIGELTKALISGQKTAGILTAVKHFPGYSGISFNPEEELAVLEKIPEISQFKKAMDINPEIIMVSNVIYQEIDSSWPFTLSSTSIQFLKTNLNSEILIISDDLDQNSLLENYSLEEIMIKPIQAGVDILIFSGWRLPVEQGLDAFWEAVKNKEISETRINETASRIIEIKQELQ